MNIDQQIRDIKDRLILARKRAGLSQGQAARLIGLAAASSLQMHEGNYSIPNLKQFLQLCDVYGVSPIWALTGYNPDFDPRPVVDALGEFNDDATRIMDLLSSIDGPITGDNDHA